MPDVRGVGECRSCWKIRLLRPKAICWNCYYARTPLGRLLRALFPPVSPRGNRYPDRKRAARAARRGPAIPPGAGREERVRILGERVSYHQRTDRPDDVYVRE